jgi:phage/plasmid-like protein (TIGR03299 family)
MSGEMFENDSAMYRKVSAWHGLGTVVDEDCNPREALKYSGLGWDVVPSINLDYYYQNEEGAVTLGTTTNKVANVRQDTGDVLGWVSPGYGVVQNSELAELAYGLGEDTVVESFGSIRNGARVYCLVRCDSFMAQRNDEVEQYMLLCNGHDGSLTLSGLPTSIRVVCSNTLRMALSSGANSMFRFTHAGDMSDKLIQAREALSFFKETGTFFKENVNRLVHNEWDKETIQRFWLNIYEQLENETVISTPCNDKEERVFTRAVGVISKWSQTFDTEMQEMNVNRPNAWTAANAVTHWLQHNSSTKGRKTSTDSRTDKNLFGKASSDSIQVMQTALSYC